MRIRRAEGGHPEILREIGAKVAEIQNEGLGEHRLRDLNNERSSIWGRSRRRPPPGEIAPPGGGGSDERRLGGGGCGGSKKKLGGILRTKPVMVDKGVAYWKLDGYCTNTAIMLQEFANEDLMGNKDKWFMFTEVQEKVIRDHVATRPRLRWTKHARV